MVRAVLTSLLIASGAKGDVRIVTDTNVGCEVGEIVVWFAQMGDGSHIGSGSHRRIEFKQALSRSTHTYLGWKPSGQGVAFFGFRREIAHNYQPSVRVLAYRPPHSSYALELDERLPGRSVVFYMPERAQPLSEAIAWVRAWRDAHASHRATPETRYSTMVLENDEIRIPQIELRTEPLSLSIDGRGTTFHPEPIEGDRCFGPEPQHRSFHFDRPFFLFLWPTGAALPDAAVWFGDTSAFFKENSHP